MNETADILVTCALSYLAIGSVFWMLLETFGYVEQTYQKWAARGEAPSAGVMIVATAFVVLTWPVPVYQFLRGVIAGARSEYRGRR